MSVEEARAIYDTMLENGELGMMLPNAEGEWEKDKKKFIKIYNENLDLLGFDDDDQLYEL